MNATQLLVLRTALTVAAVPATGFGAGFLSDPVVTHTNGMRLASTTADRSHNAYWTCDPSHLGYCNGQTYSPCRNDLRDLGTRPHGRFLPPCTTRGPIDGQAMRIPDGIEGGFSESLGTVAVDPSLSRPALAPLGPPSGLGPLEAPPAPAAGANGGLWMEALQTIQRKMMIDPDKGY
ncbi:hypothetical protein Pla108_28430 [Botrimarina colliarenosi]|uniref:Uncharacterized protein n=1 Tax=Botrimarina colliarenosi TaxID=2528001 RepID=A0A5C6ACC5_9BACT|nr:hypothetical protein [Botrimarina colliarenosi]TWT97066.1 hypothetical protein Pla108_28430 [Botrimarina colliarenosi]